MFARDIYHNLNGFQEANHLPPIQYRSPREHPNLFLSFFFVGSIQINFSVAIRKLCLT
jgi:hypothetical protein